MSAAFTFPLEAALRQREREEQQARLDLARTIGAHGAALADERDARRERERSLQATEMPGEPFSPDSRVSALYYLDRCAACIRERQGLVEQWEQEVRQARALLVAASQRRRALERLREHRRRDFDLAARRREQNDLDELVTLRHRTARAQADAEANADEEVA